jgi:hypothetical protein
MCIATIAVSNRALYQCLWRQQLWIALEALRARAVEKVACFEEINRAVLDNVSTENSTARQHRA